MPTKVLLIEVEYAYKHFNSGLKALDFTVRNVLSVIHSQGSSLE